MNPDLVPMLLDISVDPCDGSVHPSLQYVLIRGFASMGWEQPQAASEDMAMEILKMIRPNLASGGTVAPSVQPLIGEKPLCQPSRPDAGGEVRLPQGYALVPTKPTPAMIEAGCEQNPTQWNEGTDLGFAADVANDVYVAMVRAAALSTPSDAGNASAALQAMLRLFDDQGNMVADFNAVQSAVENGYAVISRQARSEASANGL